MVGFRCSAGTAALCACLRALALFQGCQNLRLAHLLLLPCLLSPLSPPLQVRDKLANLVNVRRHKMEEGLHQIGSTATVRVNGLGAYELNLIRANFQGALNMFLKLETVGVCFWGRRLCVCGGGSGAGAV